MARFISHTIWCVSATPLALIAFPWCCVGVIGCSKAALGLDSWAEVGQKQLAPACPSLSVRELLSMVHPYCMCACVLWNILQSQLQGEPELLPSQLSWRWNIWKRWNRWKVSSQKMRVANMNASSHQVKNQGDHKFNVNDINKTIYIYINILLEKQLICRYNNKYNHKFN